MKKALLTTAAVICFVSVLSACGSDGSSTSSSGSSGTTSGGTSGTSGSDPGVDASVDSSAPTTANAVTVRSNVFVPASLTVKVGDTVTWTWAGGNHDVVSGSSCAPDGAFKSSLTSKSGATFTHTFDKAGSFDYFCNPHCAVGMVGKIVVQ